MTIFKHEHVPIIFYVNTFFYSGTGTVAKIASGLRGHFLVKLAFPTFMTCTSSTSRPTSQISKKSTPWTVGHARDLIYGGVWNIIYVSQGHSRKGLRQKKEHLDRGAAFMHWLGQKLEKNHNLRSGGITGTSTLLFQAFTYSISKLKVPIFIITVPLMTRNIQSWTLHNLSQTHLPGTFSI